MPWFKVDDNFADHPKVRRIPRGQRAAAIGLWTLAGTWCARHLTDGEIPDYMLDELASKPSFADALVAVDLWHTEGHCCEDCPPVRPGFFLYHVWTQAQPTKEEVEAERAAGRERQRKARERARSQRESQQESQRDESVTPDLSQPPRPDPTRPDPLTDSSLGGERQVTLHAVPATEPPDEDREERHTAGDAFCSRHPNGNPLDQPCRGCQRAEERRTRAGARAAEKDRLDLEARARACTRCDGVRVTDDNGKPTRTRCDHRRTA